MKNKIKCNSPQSFLKTVLQIAIPVSLQALIANSLGMVDQIMIGQLGEVCVTAVSLGGRPCFILIFALGGICAAASIFASQAEGAGDKAQHSKIMKASIAGCFLCVVPFFVLSFFFPSFTLTF
ncbi:MAG: MATE family efflux transporter, partial [Treponema sp.]|nr:MATE family efflux transporter [Treponema sp.]